LLSQECMSVPASNLCFPTHSFLVGDDGKVYEGVGWNVQGSHDQGYNNISLGVAFFGTQEGNATSVDSPSKRSLLLCLDALLPSQASLKSQFLLACFSPLVSRIHNMVLFFLLFWLPSMFLPCFSFFPLIYSHPSCSPSFSQPLLT